MTQVGQFPRLLSAAWNGPGRWFSLWDLMNDFDAMRVLKLHEELQSTEGGYMLLREKSGGGVFATVSQFRELLELFKGVYGHCALEGLPRSSEAAKVAYEQLTEAGAARQIPALETHLRTVRNVLFTEVRDTRCFRIAPDRVAYLSSDDEKKPLFPFGDKVRKAFPSCADDARDAGDCLAAELPTAAVFHLMRVAEHGMRALAYDRRIEVLPKDKPIELASWEELLRELEKAENAILQHPATMAREKQYAFMHGAMMEVRAFKNVFRNRVMHTRESYGRGAAVDVYGQVRRLMQLLAEHIEEGAQTPVVWT